MFKPNLEAIFKPVARLAQKRSEKSGLPPGTPVFVGQKKEQDVSIVLTEYDESGITSTEVQGISVCGPARPKPAVMWLSISGLHDVEKITELGGLCGIHPLTIEDILNTHQRPKVEIFDNYIYISLKQNYLEDGEFQTDQVSIILGENYVISLEERKSGSFEPVMQRLKDGSGRMRKEGADFLAYALMDTIIDGYFGVLEAMGERIEMAEESLVSRPSPETLKNIHKLKRQMITLRRSVWPLRDLINVLEHRDTPLMGRHMSLYLRDLYDHSIQVIEAVESQRDIVSGMIDIYLSSVSNRLNEVMKFLTLIGTIFIPLTFITGIYGMNFEYMPELKMQWGYYTALSVMALTAGALYLYFRFKKWL